MGAMQGLTKRIFRVLEFEYHKVGENGGTHHTSLNTEYDHIHPKYKIKSLGYSCYWQGNDGNLIRFSFECNSVKFTFGRT